MRLGPAWVCGATRVLRFAEELRSDSRGAARGLLCRNSCSKRPWRRRTSTLRTPARTGFPSGTRAAPNLPRLGQFHASRPADPFNRWEPFDSSAAAIAGQGLIRLGHHLSNRGRARKAAYRQAGLTVAKTLFKEPYLSTNPKHQGLILHSVYHRPNGWDYVAPRPKDRQRREFSLGRLSCPRTGSFAPARSADGFLSDVLQWLDQAGGKVTGPLSRTLSRHLIENGLISSPDKSTSLGNGILGQSSICGVPPPRAD